MNKKQNIANKESFKQAGQDLLQKVHNAEQKDLQKALASWQTIESRLEKPRTTFRISTYYIASIAASVALIFSIGIYFWIDWNNNESMSLALLENDISTLSGNEVVLIEREDKMQLKDDASILYDADGKSNAEDHVVKKEVTQDKTEEINQIIVPKGRRADITFSDGTRMYVNAGSRVIYPAVFRKDRREILVEGEVYLDVKKDPSRPFIVKTNGFDVRVLGTQFNVCAYKGAQLASVVLVNGSVEVETANNSKSKLSPNQKIEINGKNTDISKVDVFEYICWKDNMMMLNDRKVGETLDRLSRYYGRTIWYNEEISNMPISGKLDLRDNLEDVIDILCQSLFLKYRTDERNNVIISK